MKKTIYVNYIKVFLDKIISIAVLVLFWWIYLICAIAVLIESGMPVIFSQIRVGKNAKKFRIYKFRTMVKNAEQIGPSSTAKNDKRITRVGQFLRKTSLDEIPQIFNVLLGNMSIIGFRPDVPRENDDYGQKKYLMKPGITGLAQVNGRSRLSLEDKHKLEDQYIDEVSFITDCKIILKTFKIIFDRRGVN